MQCINNPVKVLYIPELLTTSNLCLSHRNQGDINLRKADWTVSSVRAESRWCSSRRSAAFLHLLQCSRFSLGNHFCTRSIGCLPATAASFPTGDPHLASAGVREFLPNPGKGPRSCSQRPQLTYALSYLFVLTTPGPR